MNMIQTQKCVLLACLLILFLGACSKSEDDYRREADAKMAVNDVTGAETSLKAGISVALVPETSKLVPELITLYIRSNQWGKLEQYLGVVSIRGAGPSFFDGWRALADYHYAQRNWPQAYDAYTILASNTAEPVAVVFDSRIKVDVCPEDAAFYYQRASYAAYNAGNTDQYLLAGGRLQKLNEDSRCNGALNKYVTTWTEMFPD